MEPARTKSGSVSIGVETSKGGPTLAVALSFSALILTRTTLSAYDSTMTVVSSRYTIIGCSEIEGVVAKEAARVTTVAYRTAIIRISSGLNIGLSFANFDLLVQRDCVGGSAYSDIDIVALDSEGFSVPICQRTRFQWNRNGTRLAGVNRQSAEAFQFLLRARNR